MNMTGEAQVVDELPKHDEAVHVGESGDAPKPTRNCPICQKVFNHRGVLNRHVKSHTKEKPYLCEACGKTYSQKHGLKRHQDSSHNREENKNEEKKCFTCNECKEVFSNEYRFNRHLICHQIIQCEECKRTFTRKCHLKHHLRTQHGRNIV